MYLGLGGECQAQAKGLEAVCSAKRRRARSNKPPFRGELARRRTRSLRGDELPEHLANLGAKPVFQCGITGEPTGDEDVPLA
jgi:hypothetical protein